MLCNYHFYYIRASIIQVHLPIIQQRKRWIAPLFLYGYTSKLLLYSPYSWIYIFCCIRNILMVLSSLREFWNIITYLYSQGINEDTSFFRMSKVVPTIYQTNMIWKIPNLFNWKLLFMSAYLRDIDYFSNWRLPGGQKNKRIYGQLQMCVWCISLSWGQ